MSFTANLADIVAENANGLLNTHPTWERVELRNVASILNGYPFDSKAFDKSKGTPLIRIRDIRATTTDVQYTGEIPDGYWVTKGEIVVGMDGDFNTARWAGAPALLNQRVCKLTPNEAAVDKRFFFYSLGGYLQAVNAYTSSITVKHLSSKTVGDLPLPLPPHAEQKRIADKLDSVLGRVEACRDRLDRLPALLKRFRQSILAAATSGRLTEDWRATHSPEEAQRNPGAAVANLGTDEETLQTPTSWRHTQLSTLCQAGRVITYGVIKLGDETPSGVPCLRTSNVRWLDLELDGIKRIAKTLSDEYSRTILQGSEVLVNVRGTLGGVVATTPEMKGWNVSREVAVVPVATNLASAQFMALWIAADHSQRWLRKAEKGVAYVGINIEDLRDLPVALPSPEEQSEIIRRVKTLFAFADRLEARINTARKQAEQLTPALLAKAFRGELVPQDPNDEPATELLKRLAAAKSEATPRPRKATTRKTARTPRENTSMSKSRFDSDVKDQPYLAGQLKELGGRASAEALFKAAQLPVADFYKQLAWEVQQGLVLDAQTVLELPDAPR